MLTSRLSMLAKDLVARLEDPERRERTMAGVLVLYVLLWAIYCTVSTSTQELNTDMTEAAVLARDPSFGYFKHPPMSIWLAGLWFTVFPLQAWAFYLLSMAVAGVGLWAAWRIAERFLPPDKRVVGLALLTFVPFYNFHALKYNANTVMIPFWGLTILWLLRSYETRSTLYAALAGLAAAGAMLSKYWSIFLIAGLALGVLMDSRRGDYFRSWAPWTTIVVGSIALAPHLYWLVQHDFLPFSYALDSQGSRSLAAAILGGVKYLAGASAYAAAAVIVGLVAMRPTRAALRDILFPPPGNRRLAAIVLWAPMVLPILIAVPAGTRLTDLWTMPGLALLPVVLLSSPLTHLAPGWDRRIVTAAVLFPFAAVAASPIVAIAIGLSRPVPVDHRQLAEAMQSAWRQTTDRPLRIVAGDADEAYGTAFYLQDTPPSAFPFFSFEWAPYLDEARIEREGLLMVCAIKDTECTAAASARASRSSRSRSIEADVPGGSVVKRGSPQRYVIMTVPPA